MNSEELFKRALRVIPGGVHSPVRSFKGLHTTPRFIKEAKDYLIYDEDGHNYIDFCMSFGPLILGHQNSEVKEKIILALDRGWTYGACEKYSLELAEFICNKIPFIEQIRFMNSGTEAVMTAVRLARGITGRSKIIKFNGCFHGHLDSMLIKAGSGLAGDGESSSKGVTEKIISDTLICEIGDLNQVQEVLERYPNEIAGIFLEPLPANYGLLIQEQKFLVGLRKLCDKYHTLLVFDEVISGFRISFGGMVDKLDIIPDLVTYGKIIGGGMPVGAVAGKKEYMEYLAPLGPVYQAGTLSGNPVAMIAGLTTLQKLTPSFYQELEVSTQNIKTIFEKWCQQSGFEDYQIINYASLLWAVPSKDKVTNLTQIPSNLNNRFYHLFEKLLKKGIYLAPNAYEVSFVSYAHNEKCLEDLQDRLWK